MSDAEPAPSSRRLLGATAVMASGTLVSRILGFVRATLLVAALGAANPQAESFTYATLVPNTLYMLFAGGALNTVLVPQIVRHIKTDDDGGEAFVNRVMTAFLVLLAAVTLIATILTPQVMSLWTSATWRSPELAPHWTMLVLMAYLTMPQLFFFGAFFLVGQVLNARDSFGPMMWAPIVNNLVGIAVLGGYMLTWGTNASHGQPFTVEQVVALGVGSTLGIVLQTLALVPAVRRIGFRYRPRWDLRGTGLGETFHLAKWMLGYVLLTSIAQVIVSRLASDATVAIKDTPGAGMTAYQNAYLIWILPHSLLTVSLATAMLPSASRLAAAQDFAGVGAETSRTMRLANTFLLPSAVAFLVVGFPFVHLFFGFGRGADSWQFIAYTLLGFAVGLVPYTIQYVYLRGFYALENTRTPFLLQCAISGANVAFAALAVAADANPLTVAPRLALAYSFSYALGAWLTFRALAKRVPGLNGAHLLGHLVQLLVAVIPGAILAGLVTWWLGTSDSRLVLAGGLVLALALAGASFFFMAKRLGIAEATHLVDILRRRLPGGRAASASDTPDEARDPLDLAEDSAEIAQAAGVTPVASAALESGPLLAYPDPHDDHPRRVDVPAGDDPVSPVKAGQVLGYRYRLDEVLARRGGTLTWLAHDLTLSRPVLLHIMRKGEPRTLQILDEARRAAPAVDSRFLRVWDAVLVEHGDHGSYIVCEYAPGRSLELVLESGPLTDVEAAWVVREVADALEAMHARKLYHRQLNPDTVIITASGNVKLVGFLVEDILEDEPQAHDGEAADIRALGELLYACLLARWPGPARYGLPGSPTDSHGRPLTPRQVSARVSTALNDIVDRILNPVPRSRGTRLTTARDVALALGAVLGGVDASRDLEARLNFGIEPIRLTAGRVPDAAAPPVAPAAAVVESNAALPLAPGTLSVSVDVPDDGPVTQRWTPTHAPSGGATPAASDAEADFPWDSPADHPLLGTGIDPWDDDGDSTQSMAPALGELTEPHTPIPPPEYEHSGILELVQEVPTKEPARRWLVALVGTFVVVLLANLVLVFVNQYDRSRTPPPSPATPYPIVAARDFDPRADGGDNRENPDQARLAVDGDPASVWRTERYGKSSDFNGLKPGVGLIVDLGQPRSIGWVRFDLGDGVTVAELRVPQDATATTPPVTGRAAWRVVHTLPAASGPVQVKLDTPVEARFLMVYLTRLPQRDGQFSGSVGEVAVTP